MEDNMDTGYVYCHKSSLDGRVYYVGLSFDNEDGTYARANYLYARNKHHMRSIEKYGCEVEILVDNLSEDRCKTQEVLGIRYFDTFNNGCNYTLGGDGSRGYKATLEDNERNRKMTTKRWYKMTSEQRDAENKKRSDSMKASIKVAKHVEQLGKNQVGAKNPSARSVALINTGEIFSTMKEAAEKYNCNPSGISGCCLGNCKSTGRHPDTNEKLVWRYI